MDIVMVPSCLWWVVSVSQPTWRTAAVTGLAYLVALGALVALLFVGPLFL
jgi:hypothetical protein